MQHMEWLIGLVAVTFIFGGGIISQWIKGDQEIRRIKAERSGGSVNNEVLRAIEELKSEVAELRDTTTKFDMSFDAAIDRLEKRVDRLEERTTPRHSVAVAPSEEPVVLRQQGR